MDFVKFQMSFNSFCMVILIGLTFLNFAATFDDKDCEKLSVDICFKRAQTFLRLKSLPFVSESMELDQLCKQSLDGYNCSRSLLLNSQCLTDKDKDVLPLFMSMAELQYVFLCGTPDKAIMRDDLLTHSECILKNKAQLDCCAEGTHLIDLPVLRTLEDTSKSDAEKALVTCCPLSKYMQCAGSVISDACGDEAANFTVSYVRRSAGERVQMTCQKMPNYPELDSNTCPDPVPECKSGVPILTSYVVTVVVGIVMVCFSRGWCVN